VGSAEAARITLEPGGEGAGTIVNDGSDDVRSSNMSAKGNTDLLSTLGLSDGSLAADLRSLTLQGTIEDAEGAGVVTADLFALRLVGTVAQTCVDCGTVQQAQLGASGLQTDDKTLASTEKVVLFSVDLVGTTPENPVAWKGPVNFESSLDAPLVVPISPSILTYSLSEAQVQFILGRMVDNGFDVSEVRLGMALAIDSTGHVGPIRTTFDVVPVTPKPTPEPGTATLLAAGLAMAGARRWRKSPTH
jgi:hypothetical protein